MVDSDPTRLWQQIVDCETRIQAVRQQFYLPPPSLTTSLNSKQVSRGTGVTSDLTVKISRGQFTKTGERSLLVCFADPRKEVGDLNRIRSDESVAVDGSVNSGPFFRAGYEGLEFRLSDSLIF